MSAIFIKNAVLPTGKKQSVDILVSKGVIASISPVGTGKSPKGAKTIDAKGALAIPGLCDLHAHLSCCGYNAQTTEQAAMKGGITAVVASPDSSVSLGESVSIIPTAFMTADGHGEQLIAYSTLKNKGIHIISDPCGAPNDLLLLHRAMQYAAPLNLTFALRGDTRSLSSGTTMHPSTTAYHLGLTGAPPCAEEIGLETIIRLAKDTQANLHVQSVSTGESANIIRREKAQNTKALSAETALHHLIFTHNHVGDYDTTFKVTPPLRDQADVQALIDAVNDGTIDCITTHHTPVAPFEKKQDFCVAPQGMLGLETFLPALFHHLVKPGHITWKTLIGACCERPRRLANLPSIDIKEGSPANIVLFSTKETTTVSPSTFQGSAMNSPFLHQTLDGKVTHTIIGSAHYPM